MNGPLAMILVIFVIVLGIGACWAITGQAASTGPVEDTFGENQNPEIIEQANGTAGVAIETMPLVYLPFAVGVCAVLVIAFAWLWKTGRSKPEKY